MAHTLSLTVEEWAELLDHLELPEPYGVEALALAGDELEAAGRAWARRSLVGRGLIRLNEADDLHPVAASMLVTLFDADETLALSLLAPGHLVHLVWACGDHDGVRVTVDAMGGLTLDLASAEEVTEQARLALGSLRTQPPAAEQFAMEDPGFEAIMAGLVAQGLAPTVATGGTRSPVDLFGTATSWVRAEDGVRTDATVFLGLGVRGIWTVDSLSGTPVLSQLNVPWPDQVRSFQPV